MRNCQLWVISNLILAVCTGMLWAGDAGNPSNKWDGFRRYNWGTNLEKAKENDPNLVKIVQEKELDDLTYWKRKNEKLALGKADLEGVMYGAYEGRFCSLTIVSEGEVNFEYLKKEIFERYGESGESSVYADRYSWTWDKADTNGKVRAMLD